MTESFSGAHPFRPQCVLETLEAEGLNHDEAVTLTAEIVETIEGGHCPRCFSPYDAPPISPAGSRATRCRCIPVCGQCGSHESYYQAMLSEWPYEETDIADDLRARHGGVDLKDAVAAFLKDNPDPNPVPMSMRNKESRSRSSDKLPAGTSGGWAELGYDDSQDQAERKS